MIFAMPSFPLHINTELTLAVDSEKLSPEMIEDGLKKSAREL
jgi:hypothetical protein